MPKYLALLRGINVGGNNKIAMSDLKAAFEQAGYSDVNTYINSGNVIFESDDTDELAVQTACEKLIAARFALNITVGIIRATDLIDALSHAPDWWGDDPAVKHNALFVILPMTVEEVFAHIGEHKPEFEQIAFFGQVIFWSAPLATFSHTRWSKLVQHKQAYNAVTIRNANTTKKLAELARENLKENS